MEDRAVCDYCEKPACWAFYQRLMTYRTRLDEAGQADVLDEETWDTTPQGDLVVVCEGHVDTASARL